MDQSKRSPLWRNLALSFALFMAAARLCVVRGSAPLVPFWDEWNATADYILKPWSHGHVSWAALWAPHNDHRIVLTRLWEMGWFSVLGQWDPTVVATANTLSSAAVEAAFVVWIARAWTPRGKVLWLLAATALLVVPYGYETLLTGFHSQLHFLSILGLGAICAATRIEDSRWGAPVAILASALVLFSVGAGLLVAVTVGVLAALQSFVRRRVLPRTAVVWGCSVAIFAVGWVMRPPPTFAPASPGDITLAAARYAGWPASNLANLVVGWPDSARYLPPRLQTWPSPDRPAIAGAADFLHRHAALGALGFFAIALVTFLPAAFLLGRLLRARFGTVHPAAWALLGVALWAALNVLGMAVARAGDLLVPPRYQDLLVLGLLANVGALFALAGQAPAAASRGTRWLVPVWVIPTGAALLVTALGVILVQLPRKAVESAGARATVQAYVATGNRELFHGRPTNFVPWPTGEDELANLLLDPEVRAVLPVELRAPPATPSLPGRIVRGVLWLAPAAAALAALAFAALAFRAWRWPASDSAASDLAAAASPTSLPIA